MAAISTPMCTICNCTIRAKQQILECDKCLRSLHRICVPSALTCKQNAKKAGIHIGYQCPGEYYLKPSAEISDLTK